MVFDISALAVGSLPTTPLARVLCVYPLRHPLSFSSPLSPPSLPFLVLNSGVEHTLAATRASVASLRERYDRQELAAASASASASAVHARGGRRAARQREEEERVEEVALVDAVRQKRQTKCVLRG